MAKFIIPQDIIEREAGGMDTFPEGTWEGTIEVLRVQEIHRGDSNDFFLQQKGSYYADECEVGSLQIGDCEAVLQDQKSVGAMKFFDDRLMLSYDGENWDDYERSEDDPKWQLGVTQVRFTKMAAALDLTEDEDGGIGPVDHFDELVRTTSDDPAAGLNGMRIRFKVKHRVYKKRDGSEGREAQVVQYYPAG